MRRDMRLNDNHALFGALKSDFKVLPIFIFDKNILSGLPSDDARVTFIHQQLNSLKSELTQLGSDIKVYYGEPFDVFLDLLLKFDIQGLYYNGDYEPYAMNRDNRINSLFDSKGIPTFSFKDHVIFEKGEVVKKDGLPYTVFTPYKNTWLAKLTQDGIPYYDSLSHMNQFLHLRPEPLISLSQMGFSPSLLSFPSMEVEQSVIKSYDETRNFPSLSKGTSHLGIHFRFGTISIRDKVKKSQVLNATYLSELIWRDFYAQILFHFPHVVTGAFRPQYDLIEWINDLTDFENWCHGNTGYPIVDAGMRELNATGYMHNRVRMITASFLTKHLLIDWRWGEAYFAEKLLDFDLSSNNGGWQWAAGCGTDAAPYFRIFSPSAQMAKFDSHLTYVKKWVPEYGTNQYPLPIIDHKVARERCLNTYKAALN